MYPVGQNVLIVDDDLGRGQAIERILREEGFAVTIATEGFAALRAAGSEQFALVIAAVELPGTLDGVTTVRRLRARQPWLKALFTGEFASLQTSPSLDNNKQIYLIGIHDKPGAVKLIHTLFSDKINSERAEGDITFMKISTGGASSAAGTAQWDFYHVAATLDYLVIAPRLEAVRELLARHSQGAGAGLATAPGFQGARAQFPATINGLGYFDFRKVDWQAFKARLIAEANKTPTAKPSPNGGKSVATPTPSWMLDVNPEVFARHLHVASSASWKDAQGLHFDEWIE